MSLYVAEPAKDLTTLASPGAPARAQQVETPVTPHRLARRLIERFALIAFGLYHLPLFLNNYPHLGGGGMAEEGLAITWGRIFTPPGVWVARHVFQLTGPMPNAYRGDNGDVAEEFGRLLLAVVIAALVGGVWTMADRRWPRARWVGDALRVLLRYSIALGIASYAIAKILPLQFPPLDPLALETRVGDLAPMGLLWTFMRYSQPYAFISGLMELAVVLLLCFRRTATLGALLCIGVMTNVALMNYAYGVPVKLYATMTVLSAVVLVAYDAPRLIAVFVRNRHAPPARLSVLLQDRIPTPLRWTLKIVLVGSVLLSSVVATSDLLKARSAKSALDGVWRVTSFVRKADTADVGSDPSRWRQLRIWGNSIAIRRESDSIVQCQAATPSVDSMTLKCGQDQRGELRLTRTGDVVQIAGTVEGAQITASAQRVGLSEYRLMRSRFPVDDWIETCRRPREVTSDPPMDWARRTKAKGWLAFRNADETFPVGFESFVLRRRRNSLAHAREYNLCVSEIASTFIRIAVLLRGRAATPAWRRAPRQRRPSAAGTLSA